MNNQHSLYVDTQGFEMVDMITHVYTRPAIYVGSDKPQKRNIPLYDFDSNRIISANIDYVPACEQLFREIISNATDDTIKARIRSIEPKPIVVTMSRNKITVRNHGLPVPIERHHVRTDLYVPEMIFGNLLAGSNLGNERVGAGANGIGSKAVGILSKEFTVMIQDPARRLQYYQRWTNNMRNKEEPIIASYDRDLPTVEVSYIMDFERFGYNSSNGYPIEAISIYIRYCIDSSFCASIPITFHMSNDNDQIIKTINIDCRDPKVYAKYYFDDVPDNALIHYEYSKNPNDPRGTVMPIIQLIAFPNSDKGSRYSFANCQLTSRGGVHLDATIEAIGRPAVIEVNKWLESRLKKYTGGDKDKRSHSLTIKDVYPHLSIIVAVRIINAEYDSQTKDILCDSPNYSIQLNVSSKAIQLFKSSLIDRLKKVIESKQLAIIQKNTSVKIRYTGKKGIDANMAGKKNNKQPCYLILTEGDSGMGYVEYIIAAIKNGNDHYGMLPLRGKMLNVMEADLLQLEKNEEINELSSMLGLVPGTDYSIPSNFATLRYQGVIIIADQDHDGSHIRGLGVNFFYCLYNALFMTSYVMFCRTPIIRVKHNKEVIKFYSFGQYETWRNNISNIDLWRHKYYKGLGTSGANEAKEDSKNLWTCTFKPDEHCDDSMKLAFHSKRADDRKKMIANWSRDQNLCDGLYIGVTDFIYKELVQYSFVNMIRAIPCLIDGLKLAERQVVFGILDNWNIYGKGDYETMKVLQLGGHIAKVSKYQHGENNLFDLITRMAQFFVGSNNLPLISESEGQFGTRFSGGANAASARYLFTMPLPIMSRIFKKDDIGLLKYREEEGTKVEPETYFPPIPLCLINRARGIGTGWSTFIPNHHPQDVIEWLRLRITGTTYEELPVLIPWYYGYKGNIELQKREIIYEPSDLDVKEVRHQGEIIVKYAMISTGSFHIEGNTIVITELPVDRTPESYYRRLQKLIKQGKIKDVTTKSGINVVYFEIHGYNPVDKEGNLIPINEKTLGLVSINGLTNMTLLDPDNMTAKKYENSSAILEAFYQKRLPIYEQRKLLMISILKQNITKINYRLKFVIAVVEDRLILKKRSKKDILPEMDALEIPRYLFKEVLANEFTWEKIEKLKKKVQDLLNDLYKLEDTPYQELWLNDLAELSNDINVFYKLAVSE